MSTNKVFTAGIELYTGRTVESLQVHPDPKVDDSYALRAKMADGKTLDFIVCASLGKRSTHTAEDVERALEETEFTAWPPTSGKLRFFL